MVNRPAGKKKVAFFSFFFLFLLSIVVILFRKKNKFKFKRYFIPEALIDPD